MSLTSLDTWSVSPVREVWLAGEARVNILPPLTSDCRFDLAHNQVVLCSNLAPTEERVETLLAHELVHMYDHCANIMDWADSQHLACSEVRAASIAHCPGPLHSALHDGGAWTSLLSQHSQCVRSKAVRSVQV